MKQYRAKKRIILHDLTLVEPGEIFTPTSFSGIEDFIEPVEPEKKAETIRPETAAGKLSSASPAAQASQKQTSKPSSSGRRKTRKTEAS